MSNKSKLKYETICNDILNNKNFKKLCNESHHGISRYDHSLRVSKTTYTILKKFKCKNLNAATKAALLHDFYIDDEINNFSSYDKLYVHPDCALDNAKKYFEINKLQEDIIKNHMFPMTKQIPKTKEGIIVSCVDKGVALYEMLHYKAITQLGVMILFVLNLTKI